MSHLFHKLALRTSNNSRRIILYKNILHLKRKYVTHMKSFLVPNKINIDSFKINARCSVLYRPYSDSTTEEEYLEAEETLDQDIVDGVYLKNFLYPDFQDNIVEQISNCCSVQDLFNIIKEYKDLKHYHVCQSVLILWQLQKAFFNCYLLNLDKLDINFSLEKMVNFYKNEVKQHPEFDRLLNLISKHSNELSVLEISSVLFNLKRMGLTIDEPVMNELLNLAYLSIFDNFEDWSLKSAALYTAAFEPKDNLRGVYLMKNLLPLYSNAIESKGTAEDLELITIGLHNLHILISKSFLEKYIAYLKNFLNDTTITLEHTKILSKVLIFLNLPHWSRDNSEIIDFVASFFKDHVNELKAPELITLFKACHIQASSGYLRKDIRNRTNHFLEQTTFDDRVSTFTKLPDLLYCQITTSNSYSKPATTKILEDCLHHSFPPMLMTLFKVMRNLKFSRSSLPKRFWQKCIEMVVMDNIPDYLLLRLMFRYMNCNNNITLCYRSYEFERIMIQKCLNLREGIIYHLPWKMSRILSFIIAFGLDKNHAVNINILQNMILKLDSMKAQLVVFDWFVLARGLHLAKFTNHLSPNPALNVVARQINLLLNEATYKAVNSHEKLKFDELCWVCNMFKLRGIKSDSEDFIKLVCKFEQSDDALSSKRLRELCMNLYGTRLILPRLFERCVDFVVKQGESSIGETLHKLLLVFYILGYMPTNSEFFQTVINVVDRDKDLMNCLSLLQSSNALCFYGLLPDVLIKYIFSIEFMDKIDTEIESSYSQLHYSTRIRKCLMELNRAVCLELPQCDVPWFHEKYIEGEKSLTPNKRSVIYDDVLSILVNVVGSKDGMNLHHFSPYGYKVDFLLELDRKNRPIKNSAKSKNHTSSKIAVTLLDTKAYSKYCHVADDPSLPIKIKLVPNGLTLSRRRHLELMGYKVIDIHPSLWNSMHMAEPNEKYKYLKREIFENKI